MSHVFNFVFLTVLQFFIFMATLELAVNKIERSTKKFHVSYLNVLQTGNNISLALNEYSKLN